MKNSYSKEETIQILKRALTAKDRKADKPDQDFKLGDIQTVAEELEISERELQKAATEITQTKEQNRDELYPEVVSTRWIDGQLSKQEIENFFAELKMEFGDSRDWWGRPSKIHKIGNTWEYKLKNATVLVTDMEDGCQLRVIKQQFYHGNNIEAALLAIPAAFILGVLPVAGAIEWLNIFAAIVVASISYIVALWGVKKHTHKMRSDTVTKLLEITEFAENHLREFTGNKQVNSGTIQMDNRDDITSEEGTSQRNKLRS